MRLSPRVRTTLPITIDKESLASIVDISTDGVLIKGGGHDIRVGDSFSMEYVIPEYGHFEHSGQAIRLGADSFGAILDARDNSAREKLWKYILGRLKTNSECPYCGERHVLIPPLCKTCGWRLDFTSPDYFEYHEKNLLLQRLNTKARDLGASHIRKLISFMDLDILGSGNGGFQEIVGTSEAMLEVFSKIRKIAPTNISVLILGESGTGKEVTAQAIHERSMRKDKAFLPINCAAIPESLLEAELFGYERGAFTGAFASKMGKFEHADGGTLFLDEIGELSLDLQAKLLRFLENQVVERIGAIKGKKVNVRLIAATNSDLESSIAVGKFRRDLYYRLEAFTIRLPSLRERGKDKLILAKYFLKKFSGEMSIPPTFSSEGLKAIVDYPWPGNVRELINKIRRGMVMSNDHTIRPQDLDLDTHRIEKNQDPPLQAVRARAEKAKIEETLRICQNNISRAAKMLGTSRPTLYSLKNKYKI